MIRLAVVVAGVALLGMGAPAAHAQNTDMSFFITSSGSGDGANLGGLKGADARCQALAKSAGAGGRTWRAYLSSSTENARARIGNGPWRNARGALIARDIAALHSDANGIDKQTGLTESGAAVNGRGDKPNMHDILTGSNPDGTVAAGKTCNDWTHSGDGSTVVGHHDRMGLRDDAPSKSWNASHGSRGCGQEALRGTGGDGLFYCFAAD